MLKIDDKIVETADNVVHPDFGDQTFLYNEKRTEVLHAVLPTPGRVLFFDAPHHHWGRPPTGNFSELWVSLAFHLTRTEDSPVPG